jgi:hypothetical protein
MSRLKVFLNMSIDMAQVAAEVTAQAVEKP